MKYEINQDRLNELGSILLDEIYGPLHTEKDNNRYFDDNGKVDPVITYFYQKQEIAQHAMLTGIRRSKLLLGTPFRFT